MTRVNYKGLIVQEIINGDTDELRDLLNDIIKQVLGVKFGLGGKHARLHVIHHGDERSNFLNIQGDASFGLYYTWDDPNWLHSKGLNFTAATAMDCCGIVHISELEYIGTISLEHAALILLAFGRATKVGCLTYNTTEDQYDQIDVLKEAGFVRQYTFINPNTDNEVTHWIRRMTQIKPDNYGVAIMRN